MTESKKGHNFAIQGPPEKKKNMCSLIFVLMLPGVIKSDSPTPRATDFWGRASEKLPPARPRTSVFYGQSCPKLMSFKRVKINNWLLNTHRQVA